MPTTLRPSLLKQHKRLWRARLSVPSLLATYDEQKVVSVVAAVCGGLAILIIGVVAWLTDLPLLFPALGPSAFILFTKPFSPRSPPHGRWLSAIMAAMTCGVMARAGVGLACGVAVGLEGGSWLALCSATLALALTCVLLVRLRCPHAPACASALIVAVGAVTGWRELLAMAIAVMLLTLLAIGAQQFAGVNTGDSVGAVRTS